MGKIMSIIGGSLVIIVVWQIISLMANPTREKTYSTNLLITSLFPYNYDHISGTNTISNLR